MTSQAQELVKVAPGTEYPLLGVKWYAEGPFLREVVTSKTSKATRFYRVQPGQFIYNRLFAWKGAFGLVRDDLAGSYVSNEFPLFDCDRTRLLPEFLSLHFGQESVWSYVARVSTGTTASRSRWKESQFNDYELALPSPAEQRRIIDVMAAVDAQIEALGDEADRAWASWQAVVAGLDKHEGQLLLSDGLRAIEAGKSPKGQERIPDPDERAVLKISAVGRARFLPSEVKTVDSSTVLPEATKVRPGDILLVRCNAVLDRVGTVCRVNEVPENLYLCDKTLRLVPDEEVLHRNYLVHAMATPSVRDQIARLTAGSDMRNIGQRAIRELVIPDPGADVQAVLAAGLDELVSEALVVEAERSHLRAFRSALLTSLLNRENEIPESYDVLLEEVS
ncbi:restriction endonuclease subunit S [Streptomyces sp. NRRL S-350]|uniref:restriction endonuclease subunit S n=1 Tax=Streptomyces sp. NRRL S-350 TaxID=1463902 RepID=UPI00068969D8|nr:restriction endonuclease subunit S [Streptomyces sp. NRRL S-350]